MIFVPPPVAADAIMEAADAGIELIVASPRASRSSTWSAPWPTSRQPSVRLIGPNCPGIITPGQCKIGIMPGYIHKPGRIGVVRRAARSPTKAVWQLTTLGLGQSTCIGIGGDPINGTSHIDALQLFKDDPDTEAS